LLEFAPTAARKVCVRDLPGQHPDRYPHIHKMLIETAKEGKTVVRLKGGDPLIFGRGGEEVEALAAHGIPFVVIPGISAAQGAAACAGIPLTHRDHAATLVFATGHLRSHGDHGVVDLDWPMLARPRQTVVIYMGVGALPIICEQLIHHGMRPDTPAAVVEQATQPQQRTIAGTLETLPTLALVHAVKPPALIMIGAVVALHDRLGAAATPRFQLSETMVQGTPKRSVTMPIRDAKKVEASGIVT
jgi:uroporphyrin-III C-methyltransferase